MSELHYPWLEFSILVPLLGAAWVYWFKDRELARKHTIALCTVALAFALAEWIDFRTLHSFEARDHWDVFSLLFNVSPLVTDELSAPLLPLVALIHLVVILSTLRTKVGRFSFSWMLFGDAEALATFSCREGWPLVVLAVVASIPPWVEIRRRGASSRVYAFHMALFAVLLVCGFALHRLFPASPAIALVAGALMAGAGLLRSGAVPLHCWMPDLFEKASFGTSILFVTPLTGAYLIIRLVLPVAPNWGLQSIAIISLVTAVYAAGMALVQRESRRFFCYLFLSNASLVLVGLEMGTPVGLTGALCVWLSVGLALTGFGVTLRSVEARIGRFSLNEFHGLYEQMPTLAGFFLLTGLASIGFPATIGFVGMELLVEGVVEVYPLIGMAVVISAALNGIAIMYAYFRVFTGRRHVAPVSLRIRPTERIAVLLLSFLILGGGIVPQPGVSSRYHAATAISKRRADVAQRQAKGRSVRPAH